MNRKGYAFLVNLLVLLAGVVLVALYDEVSLMRWVVVAMGVMFLVPSVVALLLMLSQLSRRVGAAQEREVSAAHAGFGGGLLTMVGCICFGILLVIRPLVFVELLAYLFAIMLIIGGLYHVVTLIIATRKVAVSLWLFVLPALIALAGFVLLLSDIRDVEAWVNLITGVAFICFSLSSLVGYFVERKVKRSAGTGQ